MRAPWRSSCVTRAALPLPGLVRKNWVGSFDPICRGPMADSQEQTPVDSPAPRGSGRLRSATAIFGFILLAIGCVLWLSRERIADNVIGAQLRGMDLPATYRIVRIGGQRQVLADIRIGDPARP